MIFQLAYLSFQSDQMKDDIDGEIQDILECANKHNKEHEITGILLYKGGAFLQLLEGDEKDIVDLYGKIASDLRHERPTVVLKQYANERIFKDWSMAFQKVNDLDLEKIESVLPWSDIIEKTNRREPISNNQIKEFFQFFLYKLKG
jgi:hypothetical protein